jgi:mannonate dehydratase
MAGYELKLSLPIKPTPSDEDLLFIRQLGVRYVYTWVKKHQISVRFIGELKQRLQMAGLVLYNVGNKDAGKSDSIHLALEDRDRRIEDFQRFIEILGSQHIGVTTFTWEPDNVWSSDPGSTRDCITRRVDLEELKTRPLTHGRRYSREELWQNYSYFVQKILPVAEAHGVKLALHPNDPPTEELGGVPCLINSQEAYRKAFEIGESPSLGMEFCTGCWLEGGESFGSILEGLEQFLDLGKVLIVHFRNVSSTLPIFTETFLDNGYMDMYQIMKVLVKKRYMGTVTLDHTPRFTKKAGMESAMAYAIGYMRALYERALEEVSA